MGLLDVIGTATGFAKDIVDRVWPKKLGEDERARAVLEIETMIEERDKSLIDASRDIMVAELRQGDTYTKRARPTIVYVGLGAILFNHVLIPFINRVIEWVMIFRTENLPETFSRLTPLDLPSEFWYVWAGVCSVYSLGRTAEKKGARHALIGWMTGNKDLHEAKP